MLLVEIITTSDKVAVPAYATIGSAAVDIYPNIDKPINIYPGETKRIPTGFKVSINDPNYCLKLYPRSGAGVKGMVLGNCVGIIDSDYQEEVFAAITNRLLEGVITVEPGKACCQMILEKVEKILFAKVDSFTAKRGERVGGFGSTDKKVVKKQIFKTTPGLKPKCVSCGAVFECYHATQTMCTECRSKQNNFSSAPVYGHIIYTCPECHVEYTPYRVEQVKCVQCEMTANPITIESERVLKPGKIQLQGKCALCEGDFPADTLVTIHGKHWCKNCSAEVI